MPPENADKEENETNEEKVKGEIEKVSVTDSVPENRKAQTTLPWDAPP